MNKALAMATLRFSPSVLAATLTLGADERAEMVAFDPVSGDYRVFYVGLDAIESGGVALAFELYREGPGYEPRLFEVLSLTLGDPDADGFSAVEAFHCDAGTSIAELALMLITLSQITIALKLRQRPDDALLITLLSPLAQVLWTQPLEKGAVA